MKRGRRISNNSIMLAISSVLAVFAGIAANLFIDPNSFGWLGDRLVAGAAAIAGLAAAVLLRRTSGSTTDFELSEEAAIRRIRTTLSSVSDAPIWPYSNIDLEPSVALQRNSSDPNEQSYLQTSSAFIANLTSDPRCTIVTGQPGSGKSTLLWHLALKMATARERKEFRFTPLLLQCRDWSSGSELESWVSNQTRYVYGIPPVLTKSWINRGTALLILDGADEVADEVWPLFLSQVNRWLNSPVGGRIILSCRNDAYASHFRGIRHDQVANLEPLPHKAIRKYFSKLIDKELADPSRKKEVQSLVFNLVLTTPEDSPGWSTPLLVRMLTQAVLEANREPGSADTAADPGALAVELGDALSKKGDKAAAIQSYMTGIKSQSPQWRSLAGVRASVLLAHSGDHEGARRTLERSLADEIKKPLHEALMPIEDHLSSDELAVLRVLSSTKSLDAFQISSLASVPPGRCNNALRQLRDRGLVEVPDKDGVEPRFERSAVELIEQ